MNKTQWLVLLLGLVLVSPVLATWTGSDSLEMTVSGRRVILYNSSSLPDSLRWPVLLGLLLLTAAALVRLRTPRPSPGRPAPAGLQEETWPPPPERNTIEEAGLGTQDQAEFSRPAQSVFLTQLTAALTVFALFEGRSLARALFWPGLGWHRWILGAGEMAFVAALVWLWAQVLSRFRRGRKSAGQPRDRAV